MQNVRGLLFNAALVFAFVIFSNLLRKEKTPPIKMKAVVSDGKKGIRVADIPTPELKEGQILIKVIAAAQVSSCDPSEGMTPNKTRPTESDRLASLPEFTPFPTC